MIKKSYLAVFIFPLIIFAFIFLFNQKALAITKEGDACFSDWRTERTTFVTGGCSGGTFQTSETTRIIQYDVSNFGSCQERREIRERVDCPTSVGSGGRIEIQPSLTPRPACFTSWGGTSGEGGGGLDPGQCDSLWESYRQTSPLAVKRYIGYQNTPHCTFAVQYRQPALCPLLDSAVKLSADVERPEENGKFTINWSSDEETNPEAKCVLSGKAPEKGNFSEETRGGSRTYTFVQRGIYNFKFSCEGILDNAKSLTKGTVSKNVTIYAGNIPPAPKVDFKAEPATIKKGESATLSWISENAIVLSINQGIGVVGKSGTIKVSPSNTTRYTITGAGEFSELGLARKSVTLRVTVPAIIGGEEVPVEVPPEVVPPTPEIIEKPKIDLKVNGQDGPLTIGVPASFNLSWNLDRYCLAYGSWLGVKNKAGSERRTETKAGTYTYKIYCPGAGTDEATVKVVGGSGQSAVPLPVAEASASLDGKNFSKSIRVVRGQKINLWLGAAYDTDGDKRASRDETGKWTSAISSGGRCEWNMDLNQGDPTFEIGAFDPKNPQDCTLRLENITFFDKPGVYRYGVLRLVQADGKISNTSYINIAVQEPPPPKGPPVITLKVNNLEDSVTLGAPAEYDVIWNAQNADTCSASGSWDGEKFPAGSQHFAASGKRELTYAITCSGKLGTASKSINVKVAELPVCDFSALPSVLDKNAVFIRESVLSWKCQFANSCEISPTIGETDIFGSIRVSPKTTSTYTLTCRNLDGSSSFDQIIEVR